MTRPLDEVLADAACWGRVSLATPNSDRLVNLRRELEEWEATLNAVIEHDRLRYGPGDVEHPSQANLATVRQLLGRGEPERKRGILDDLTEFLIRDQNAWDTIANHCQANYKAACEANGTAAYAARQRLPKVIAELTRFQPNPASPAMRALVAACEELIEQLNIAAAETTRVFANAADVRREQIKQQAFDALRSARAELGEEAGRG